MFDKKNFFSDLVKFIGRVYYKGKVNEEYIYILMLPLMRSFCYKKLSFKKTVLVILVKNHWHRVVKQQCHARYENYYSFINLLI